MSLSPFSVVRSLCRTLAHDYDCVRANAIIGYYQFLLRVFCVLFCIMIVVAYYKYGLQLLLTNPSYHLTLLVSLMVMCYPLSLPTMAVKTMYVLPLAANSMQMLMSLVITHLRAR